MDYCGCCRGRALDYTSFRATLVRELMLLTLSHKSNAMIRGIRQVSVCFECKLSWLSKHEFYTTVP